LARSWVKETSGQARGIEEGDRYLEMFWLCWCFYWLLYTFLISIDFEVYSAISIHFYDVFDPSIDFENHSAIFIGLGFDFEVILLTFYILLWCFWPIYWLWRLFRHFYRVRVSLWSVSNDFPFTLMMFCFRAGRHHFDGQANLSEPIPIMFVGFQEVLL
jgi:hypothetical protein